jgi:hypothetical protein
MTGKELEKSIKDIWTLFRETDRRLDQRFKETDQRFRETDQRLDQRFNETDKQLKELSKQIGGLGNKFGGFTEGMAYPSMKRILQERFKMEYVSPRVEVHKNGETIELDVLAYSNEESKAAFIVEVKSRLKEEHLKEILRDLERFPRFFPEHKDKALYGIIAAVDVSEQMKKKVLRSGLYLAIIRDDMFQLDVPADFKPKRFN